MGLELEDEGCFDAITPGWLVTVANGEERYLYHTDNRGLGVKVEPANQNSQHIP